MDLLELPLEAVAVRLYSLPVGIGGSAAWTFLAAVLAAAGLWRLRSCTPTTVTDPSEPSPPPPVIPPAPRSSGRSSEPASSPKVRYTAYYHESGRIGCCHVDDVARDDDEGVDDVIAPPFEWDTMGTKRRTAELGWYWCPYEYQDSTSLNGSVVTLWNGSDGGLTAS